MHSIEPWRLTWRVPCAALPSWTPLGLSPHDWHAGCPPPGPAGAGPRMSDSPSTMPRTGSRLPHLCPQKRENQSRCLGIGCQERREPGLGESGSRRGLARPSPNPKPHSINKTGWARKSKAVGRRPLSLDAAFRGIAEVPPSSSDGGMLAEPDDVDPPCTDSPQRSEDRGGSFR